MERTIQRNYHADLNRSFSTAVQRQVLQKPCSELEGSILLLQAPEGSLKRCTQTPRNYYADLQQTFLYSCPEAQQTHCMLRVGRIFCFIAPRKLREEGSLKMCSWERYHQSLCTSHRLTYLLTWLSLRNRKARVRRSGSGEQSWLLKKVHARFIFHDAVNEPIKLALLSGCVSATCFHNSVIEFDVALSLHLAGRRRGRHLHVDKVCTQRKEIVAQVQVAHWNKDTLCVHVKLKKYTWLLLAYLYMFLHRVEIHHLHTSTPPAGLKFEERGKGRKDTCLINCTDCTSKCKREHDTAVQILSNLTVNVSRNSCEI